jgi:hypothetical protein
VAHLAEIKNTYIILIGNRQGKTFLLLYQSHSVVFGEQSGNSTVFYLRTSVFPVILVPPMLSIHVSVIREQHNGCIGGRTRKTYIHRYAPPQ